MAQFTMSVKSSILRTDYPFTSNEIDTNCYESVDVTVIVPAGQSRYVMIIGSGIAAGGQNITETISANKTYTLILDANVDTATPSNNTLFSSLVMHVKLSASDPIFWTKQINRTHTPNIC